MKRDRRTFRVAGTATDETAVDVEAFFRVLRAAADAAYSGPPAGLALRVSRPAARYRFALEAAAATALIVASGTWIVGRIGDFAQLLGDIFTLFL